MRGQHELNVDGRQCFLQLRMLGQFQLDRLVTFRPSQVMLLGDVGQVQELVECSRHIHHVFRRNGGEETTQVLPLGIAAVPRGLGERTNLFDLIQECFTTIICNHPPQYPAEVPDVITQWRFEMLDFPRGRAVFFSRLQSCLPLS